MTVDRSRVASDAEAIDAANAEASDVGPVADPLFSSLELVRVDRISLSNRAGALLAAGLALRAFVAMGIEDICQRVALDRGRWLVLESGIYGLRS